MELMRRFAYYSLGSQVLGLAEVSTLWGAHNAISSILHSNFRSRTTAAVFGQVSASAGSTEAGTAKASAGSRDGRRGEAHRNPEYGGRSVGPFHRLSDYTVFV